MGSKMSTDSDDGEHRTPADDDHDVPDNASDEMDAGGQMDEDAPRDDARDASETSDDDGGNDDDGGDDGEVEGDDDPAVPEPLSEIESDVDDDHTFPLSCITSGIDGEATTTVRAKLSRDMKGMAVPTERIVRLGRLGLDSRMILCNLKMLRRLLFRTHLFLALCTSCLSQLSRTVNGNKLSELPDLSPLSSLRSLLRLFLAPSSPVLCTALTHLLLATVSHNRFSVIPDSIRSLTALDELDSLLYSPHQCRARTHMLL